MFQYASLISIANATNRTPVLGPGFMQLRRTFNISLPVRPAHVISGWRSVVIATKNYTDIPVDLETIRNLEGNILLECRCISRQYFHKNTARIRQDFIFRKSVMRSTDAFWDSLGIINNVTTVGIHIRGTDYNTTERIRKGFGAPPTSYYHKAMQYFRQRARNTLFVVCSDDIKWAERNINGRDVIFSHRRQPEVDLAILASCDHVIMSKGTFSFWAGWLSGGTAMYYRDNATSSGINTSMTMYPANGEDKWIPVT
jgi:galactoside 2-L-fucosyltransferase 1/2